MFAVFQVIMQILKDFNYNQKLRIMSIVLSFHKHYFLEEKDYWILLTNFARLGKVGVGAFVGHVIGTTLI